MGAYGFDYVLVGKDLQSAVRQASESDRHEYGHDAYTGDIGQKYGAALMGSAGGGSINKIRSDFWAASWAVLREADGEKLSAKDRNLLARMRKNFRNFDRFVRLADDKWASEVVAIEVTGKAKTETKIRHGRKGTRDSVWIVFGMAAC